MDEDECLAQIIMIGWDRKKPNVLISPKSFIPSRDIAILPNKKLVLADKLNTENWLPDDELKFDSTGAPEYSTCLMLEVILENTANG